MFTCSHKVRSSTRRRLRGTEALRSDWEDVYIDPNSSWSMGWRDTLHTPTNSIWSTRMKRFLAAAEHLRLQGIFPEDFGNPDAVRKLLRSAHWAWTSPARFLVPQCSEVNCCACWSTLRPGLISRSAPRSRLRSEASRAKTHPRPAVMAVCFLRRWIPPRKGGKASNENWVFSASSYCTSRRRWRPAKAAQPVPKWKRGHKKGAVLLARGS